MKSVQMTMRESQNLRKILCWEDFKVVQKADEASFYKMSLLVYCDKPWEQERTTWNTY
jgi:hypothetical protein